MLRRRVTARGPVRPSAHPSRPRPVPFLLFALVMLFGACGRGSRVHQGALVGLSSGRTLWIAWPNDSARIVTEKPHLLVPRDDGMWWAGVVTRCVVEEGG